LDFFLFLPQGILNHPLFELSAFVTIKLPEMAIAHVVAKFTLPLSRASSATTIASGG
jgi:hypothetical protein